jgi:hypothetical protein
MSQAGRERNRHNKLLGTTVDMDSERGMGDEEEYYLMDSEIIDRLNRASFTKIRKKFFVTQWALNHLFIAWKEPAVAMHQ